MHRFTVFLALVVLLVVGGFVVMSRGVAAYDDLTANHSIVGARE